MLEFDEYIRNGEPDKATKASTWRTAIGLQAVDGLQTSDYLKDTAIKHIEGDISIEEVKTLINSYYQSKTERSPSSDTEEADKVSMHIAQILNENAFSYSVIGLTSIHRRLFDGVFPFAGQIRNYNITKKEWVLRGASVLYVNAEDLTRAIAYDLEQERQFSYKDLPLDDVVVHIAKFVADLWQIHPFGEGNTRTTAVFTIKYLQNIGFAVNNDLFAEHAWYFRNALVRANYRNVQGGIEPDMSFLILFFRNLILGEQHELKNRYMIINTPKTRGQEKRDADTRQVPDKYPTSTQQVSNELQILSNNVRTLLDVLAEQPLSLKEMIAALQLKDRENFMLNYLTPALRAGWVVPLYPDTPKHPRQKYQLTLKGKNARTHSKES